jgi:DNA modification methylase
MTDPQGKLFRIQAAQEWSHIADDDLPVEDTWVVIRDNNAYHTVHRFHPYFAMCPPPLARRAIETYSKPDDLVVDPFCGAGVTMAEAMLAGRNSSGVDVLSMARFISKVKTTPIEVTQEEAFAVADSAERIARRTQDLFATLPPVYNVDFWFSEVVQHQMGAILRAIGKEKDPDKRDFYRLAFSGIVRPVSRAGNLEAHLHIKLGKPAAHVFKLFRSRLFDMVTRERHFSRQLPSPVPSASVHDGDARDLSDLFPDESVDMIFTSPPYGSGTKYASVYRLHMELLQLPRTTPRRALESAKDFTGELTRCFGDMFRMLKPGGTLALLYGTNKYFSSREIATLNEEKGFHLETSIACPVIDESKMVRGDYRRAMGNEHLLILVKGK